MIIIEIIDYENADSINAGVHCVYLDSRIRKSLGRTGNLDYDEEYDWFWKMRIQ